MNTMFPCAQCGNTRDSLERECENCGWAPASTSEFDDAYRTKPSVCMSRLEKAFVIFYWLYMAIYIPCFFMLVERHFFQILPFHFLGMFLGLVLLIIVFRDLYRRDFPDPNTKVTWTILMLLFWPSILVYLYKHAFRTQ